MTDMSWDCAAESLFDSCGEDGEPCRYDAGLAKAVKTDVSELFAQARPDGPMNYRKAMLYPPHGCSAGDLGFDRINRALFPKGTGGLEVCGWSTDWSDWFDDGREWWGTLCLTVYDKNLDRFVVIAASATD